MSALVTSDSSLRRAFVSGALTVILPAFSPNLLLLVLLAFIWTERRAIPKNSWAAWLPFLIVCGAWTFGEFLPAFDLQLLRDLWRSQPTRALALLAEVRYWRASNASWIRALGETLRCIAFLGMLFLLQSRELMRRTMIDGVIVGLAVALPITVLQLVLRHEGIPLHGYFPQQTTFWDRVGRIPSTFSDPNAYGIALAIALPLILMRAQDFTVNARRWSYVCIGAWTFLALFSGSRTFVLLLGISFAAFAARKRVLIISFLSVALVLVVAMNIFPFAVEVAYVPEGARRILRSLVVSKWNETFFSRLLFLRVGSAVFLLNPWLGAGLGTFRQFVVPLTADMPGVIPLWSDNPNNFYLGIAAETGIFGLAALLYGMSSLRFRANASPLLRATALGFLLALFFGPHLDFIEIIALSSLLLAGAVESRERAEETIAVTASISLVPFILFLAHFSEQGFYPWERSSSWYFRWTERRAQGYTECHDGHARLLLRAPRAHHSDSSTEVIIRSADFMEQHVDLHGDAVTPVMLPCDSADSSRTLHYTLVASDFAKPRFGNKESDSRALAIQVVTKHPAESLP